MSLMSCFATLCVVVSYKLGPVVWILLFGSMFGSLTCFWSPITLITRLNPGPLVLKVVAVVMLLTNHDRILMRILILMTVL